MPFAHAGIVKTDDFPCMPLASIMASMAAIGRKPVRLRRRAMSAVAVAAVAGLPMVQSAASATVSSTTVQWGTIEGASGRPSPVVVAGVPKNVVTVQAANWGGMAIDAAGNVWDWGNGSFGDLGNGTTAPSLNRAVQVSGVSHAVSIGEGNDFGAAVDASGDVWVWGWNDDGQLCLTGGPTSVTRPVEISGLGALAVAGGGNHLLILRSNGTVDACGLNSSGQLGDGTFGSSPGPMRVARITNVVSISAGNKTSAALERNGSVWTWGDNDLGQLGIGNTANQDTPHEVIVSGAAQVYAGGDYPTDGHMLVLLDDGQVKAWGDNACNQLGDGHNGGIATSPQLVRLPTGVTVTKVAAGGADSFVVDSAGHVWAWGGQAGTLGNGTEDSCVAAPVQVGSGFSLLSATSEVVVGSTTSPP